MYGMDTFNSISSAFAECVFYKCAKDASVKGRNRLMRLRCESGRIYAFTKENHIFLMQTKNYIHPVH